jgi:hypothetical protein
MALDSGERRIRPKVLVGKILALIGAIFFGISLLFGGYTLFAGPGAASAQGNVLLVVTGLLALNFGGIGLLMLLAGLVLRLIPGNSASADVVDHYYAALANQDYLTASQYLDHYMKTPQGQPITPAWFVQRAQAYDAEQGRVTDYRLSGVRANPGLRRFTLKVTRGSSAYKNNLFLRQRGNEWKITGFDRF